MCGKVHKPRPYINLCCSVNRSTEKKHGIVEYIVHFYFDERVFLKKKCTACESTEHAPWSTRVSYEHTPFATVCLMVIQPLHFILV